MLNILRKTTATLTRTTRSYSADKDDVVGVVGDDISKWEFVNASLSDDEDIYTFDGEDSTTVESESKAEEGACESRDSEPRLDDVVSLQPLPPSPIEVTRHHEYDEEEEEEDYDVDDDVDDELVPWKLKDRFGKQRMKKIGKRGGVPKHNKSKRLPYYLNRPGCSYVKHALGVQHSYI